MFHAVVEGVCMHLRWQMTAMEKLTPISKNIRFVGGGARTPAICQILSDVLHKPVYTVDDPHNVGSVGAAAIIATGLGVFGSVEDIADSIIPTAAYVPLAQNSNVYNELFGTFQDLYKNNKKSFKKLNGNEVLV
jgi:xylulokinase